MFIHSFPSHRELKAKAVPIESFVTENYSYSFWRKSFTQWLAVCLFCKVCLLNGCVHERVPQSFVKGLAREFPLEELGDIVPVHLNLSCLNDSFTAFHFLFLLQVCAAVHRLVLMFTVADEADEVAWRIKRCRGARTGLERHELHGDAACMCRCGATFLCETAFY